MLCVAVLAWHLAMSAFGISVVADARETQIALARGAREVDPIYRPLPPNLVPAARLIIGGGAGVAFNEIHKYHPRTAWALLIGATVINAASARHNSYVGIGFQW